MVSDNSGFRSICEYIAVMSHDRGGVLNHQPQQFIQTDRKHERSTWAVARGIHVLAQMTSGVEIHVMTLSWIKFEASGRLTDISINACMLKTHTGRWTEIDIEA